LARKFLLRAIKEKNSTAKSHAVRQSDGILRSAFPSEQIIDASSLHGSDWFLFLAFASGVPCRATSSIPTASRGSVRRRATRHTPKCPFTVLSDDFNISDRTTTLNVLRRALRGCRYTWSGWNQKFPHIGGSKLRTRLKMNWKTY
jgi:hypothetical protein